MKATHSDRVVFRFLFANIFSSAHSSLLIRAVGFHTVLPHLCVFLSLFFLSSLRIFRSIQKSKLEGGQKTTWRGDLASSHRTRHTPFTTRAPRGVSSETRVSRRKRIKALLYMLRFRLLRVFLRFPFLFFRVHFRTKSHENFLSSRFLFSLWKLITLFVLFLAIASSSASHTHTARSSSRCCFTLR